MVQAGDLVGDRYRLVEPLASGGMGTVWRAHHAQLDVDVALKLISAALSAPSAQQRFRREAQAAARLRSPHVVQVLDFGLHEGQPYLVMELLRGENLAQQLERQGSLPLPAARHVVDGLCKALRLAHDEGIVHRDLKPANIFLQRLGDEDIVKVLDFGIAKDTRGVNGQVNTTDGALLGSPAYMSPEQVLGDPIGPQSDLWALGVVAFETVTGKCPFDDETLARIFDRILRCPIPGPRDLKPELPVALDAFFQRALARAPHDRFASPEAFSAAFQLAVLAAPLAHSTLAAHGVALASGSERPRVSASRRQRLWLLAAAVLAAGGAGASLLRSGHTGPAPRRAEVPPVGGSATPNPRWAPEALPSRLEERPGMKPPAADAALAPAAAPAAATTPRPARPAPPTQPKPHPPNPDRSAAPSAPAVDSRFGIPLPD